MSHRNEKLSDSSVAWRGEPPRPPPTGPLCPEPAFAIVRPVRFRLRLGELMADNAHHGHSDSGGQDIRENVSTWHAFTKGVKWAILGMIVIAMILLIFRTNG